MTTARNLKDYARMVEALVSQPKLLREYRLYAAARRLLPPPRRNVAAEVPRG